MATAEELAALLASDLVSASDARPHGLALLPDAIRATGEPSHLVGPHLLQVEDVVDLTLTEEERRLPFDERANRSARMLKLLLTDGAQSVCAIEYRRLDALSERDAIGAKLFVHNVAVRRGLA